MLLEKATREEIALQYVKEVRAKDPGIGGKKLWHMYRQAFSGSNPMGRDHFEDMINTFGLKVRNRIRKPRTTDSTHGLPVYPNLVKGFIPTRVNQLWVSDITYIPIWVGDDLYVFCYLTIILDAYSEEIIGWSVSMSLETRYSVQALEQALSRIHAPVAAGLIHHSDRGTQYASRQYVDMLRQHGVGISMTESGDPKDNAKAERINNTVKNELLKDMRFTSLAEVAEALDAAIKFYNEERPHMSVDMMTPREAATRSGEIRKRWTSYREMRIRADMATTEINPVKRSPS